MRMRGLLFFVTLLLTPTGCKSNKAEKTNADKAAKQLQKSLRKLESTTQTKTVGQKPTIADQSNNLPGYCQTRQVKYIMNQAGNQVKNGPEWKCYYRGRWRSAVTYVNGKLNGVAKYWHSNRNLKEVSHYQNGVPIRNTTRWFWNGKKKQVIKISKEGLFETKWYSNGQIKATGLKVEEIGQLKTKLVKHGLHKEWWRNGIKYFEGSFVRGTKEGGHTYWSSKGMKTKEQNYKNGQKHGVWKKWNSRGVLLFSTSYSENKKNGLHSSWSGSGKLYEKGRFFQGKRCGKFLRWYKVKKEYDPCPANKAQAQAWAACAKKLSSCQYGCKMSCSKKFTGSNLRQKVLRFGCQKRCKGICRKAMSDCRKKAR